jgi:hypothetical protein
MGSVSKSTTALNRPVIWSATYFDPSAGLENEELDVQADTMAEALALLWLK